MHVMFGYFIIAFELNLLMCVNILVIVLPLRREIRHNLDGKYAD